MVHTLPGIVAGAELSKIKRKTDKLAAENEKLQAEAAAWARVDEFVEHVTAR